MDFPITHASSSYPRTFNNRRFTGNRLPYISGTQAAVRDVICCIFFHASADLLLGLSGRLDDRRGFARRLDGRLCARWFASSCALLDLVTTLETEVALGAGACWSPAALRDSMMCTGNPNVHPRPHSHSSGRASLSARTGDEEHK